MIMNLRTYISTIGALILAAAVLFTSCKEPVEVNPAGGVSVENGFVFEGTRSDIGSVVRFDQDNNTVQFWLSPSEGVTDIDQMGSDCLVLSVHKSYLGSRDRMTKAGSFVKCGGNIFSAGDDGIGYIETSIQGDSITLKFAVEKFSVRSDAPSLTLSGEYYGKFSTFNDEPYTNEWAIDRERRSIGQAEFILREDGGNDTFILYEDKDSRAIEFTIPQSRRGKTILFNTSEAPLEGFTARFSDGKEIDMTKVYGSVKADAAENSMKVSFDLTFNGERIRAEYDGVCKTIVKKANRYIYASGYPYSTNYDGKYFFSELRIEESYNSKTFKFIPEGTDEMYSDIPVLTITDSALIGKENIDMRNTGGWSFRFDKINVSRYENEWKPAPSKGSTLSITEDNGTYRIEITLETVEPTFKYVSTIDLYYEGPATIKK